MDSQNEWMERTLGCQQGSMFEIRKHKWCRVLEFTDILLRIMTGILVESGFIELLILSQHLIYIALISSLCPKVPRLPVCVLLSWWSYCAVHTLALFTLHHKQQTTAIS